MLDRSCLSSESMPLAQLIGNVGLGGNKLAGLAVEHVEEAVLVRLHDDLAALSVDREIGKGQLPDGVVVPLLSGVDLECQT